jgi:ribosome-associated toxin RatA of RatAB toxin-antitoxin module
MGRINRSTVVNCSPDRVFAVLAEVERLPEFSEMTVDVRNGPRRPVQPGDSFDQVVKVLGKELETSWRVIDVDEPSVLRFEGTATAGATATLEERLTPEGTGTRVELDVDYDLPLGILGDAVDAVYLHSKSEEQADEILTKLKAICEAAG